MRYGAPISLLLAVSAALSCGWFDRPPGALQAANEFVGEASEPAAIPVETSRVKRGAIQPRVSAPGSLMAHRVSAIGPEVRGRIAQIFVDEGDRVAAGDRLFQIDRTPFEVGLRQAEAGLQLARSEREQIEIDMRRLDQLHQRAIVSVDERDRMRTNVAVARAREAQAREAVAMARYDLDQTLVVAPFAGSIGARLVDEGTTALVQPQTIVVVLHETTLLEAVANIPESQRAHVQVGDTARVYVDGSDAPIETRVASVGDTIDADTRTYRVRMPIQNDDHRLKAGVFARVDIEPTAKQEVLMVPREAVRSEAGRTRVLVMRDGRAEAVPVRLGIASGSHAEVLSGLDPNDHLIVGDSAREIAPGMRVAARPEHEAR